MSCSQEFWHWRICSLFFCSCSAFDIWNLSFGIEYLTFVWHLLDKYVTALFQSCFPQLWHLIHSERGTRRELLWGYTSLGLVNNPSKARIVILRLPPNIWETCYHVFHYKERLVISISSTNYIHNIDSRNGQLTKANSVKTTTKHDTRRRTTKTQCASVMWLLSKSSSFRTKASTPFF